MTDIESRGLFLRGGFVPSSSGKTFPVYDPHTDEVYAKVAEAGTADVDAAVDAAREAFDGPWSALAPKDRGRLLLKLARIIQEHGEALAQVEARNSGHPIRDVRRFDLVRTVDWFEYFGGMATKVQGDVIPSSFKGVLNYTLREPLGVVGQIVPWNFPLMFVAWNIAPALAAGNTVVLKPAEYTPMSALEVARLSVDAGFPPGTINVVPGKGSVAGARLARHPDVAKICFTGSVEVGQDIIRAGADTLKKPLLELGGKGPNIVFADADLAAAVQGSLFAAYHNQGQACIAGSRLFVHESIWDDFLKRFTARVRSVHHDHALQGRRGRGRDGQRRAVRTRGWLLDPRPGARPPDRGTAQGGHGLGECLQARRPGLAVRRVQDERHGLGVRSSSDARVHAGQERLGRLRFPALDMARVVPPSEGIRRPAIQDSRKSDTISAVSVGFSTIGKWPQSSIAANLAPGMRRAAASPICQSNCGS